MKSLRELFRYGRGPSSSHSMGPQRAAQIFRTKFPASKSVRVILYGSLAATGKGHLTDQSILLALKPIPVSFVWKPDSLMPLHPNGMCFESLDDEGRSISKWEVYSVGGGALLESGDQTIETAEVYSLTHMKYILEYCEKKKIHFWEYVFECEDAGFPSFLEEIWLKMNEAIEHGIVSEGVLSGGLNLERKAHSFSKRANPLGSHVERQAALAAYVLSVAEENAAGGFVVTAPTCGACGVVPGVLRYLYETHKSSKETALRALATAGLIGNLAKQNASISGAEVGCQGEIGVACAMAAGAATQWLGGTIQQIEYAAEMGLEHHLGLTCDPVNGLVQIPCIERNFFAAARALTCADYALFSDGQHRIPFDEVVEVMLQTGHDLPSLYRETSSGGLATAFQNRFSKSLSK